MPMIDPELQKYMDRQRMQSWLQNVSQGLIQAGAGGAGFGPGLAMGIGAGGSTREDPMQMLQMQRALDQRKSAQKLQTGYQQFLNPPIPNAPTAGGGPAMAAAQNPRVQQLASAGGMPPGGPAGAPGAAGGAGPLGSMPPELKALLATLPPEVGTPIVMDYLTKGPPKRETYEDALGRERFQDTGEFLPGEVEDYDPKLLSPAALDQKIKLAREGKSVTSQTVNLPKDVTETQGMLQAIEDSRTKFEETGDPQYQRLADALEMKLTFGGNPPEAYVKANTAFTMARGGLSDVYGLISQGTDAILPNNRAKLAQAFEQARLGLAELTNRGANFTDTEQEMIASVLGGDPKDIVQRILRGDKSYLETIKKASEIIEDRGQSLLRSYTSTRSEEFTYPWEAGAQTPADQLVSDGPQKISGDEDYDALPSGAQFIGPDGVLRMKP